MNKKKLLERLKQVLEESGSCGLYFDKGFITDLRDLLIKEASGNEPEVLKLFEKQIRYVIDLGTDVFKADSNEILKDIPYITLYSLHIQNRIVNFRLLITFDNYTPVFLSAFSEKAGKKVSEYSKYIPIALERYNDYLS